MRAFSSSARALGGDPAAVEHGDAVGEPVGLLEVLGREEDRGAGAGERADDAPQLLPAAGVEAGGRLVEEQHGRRDDEAEREVEASAHAARVGADAAARGIREVEPLEELGRARVRASRRAEPREPAHHDEVLGAGEHAVDGGRLAGEADAALDLLGVGDDVVAGDPRGARIGPHERREDVDGRRLARAVRPEQGEHGAGGHREVEPREHLGAPEALAESACVDGEVSWPAPFVGVSAYDANCLCDALLFK